MEIKTSHESVLDDKAYIASGCTLEKPLVSVDLSDVQIIGRKRGKGSVSLGKT